MIRKCPLTTGQMYHVMNKSIAEYLIFNNHTEFARFILEITYYMFLDNKTKFSDFKRNFPPHAENKRVAVLAYTLMPTHFHILLRQNVDNGISEFMNFIENSYSHYFNKKHNRMGPLWVGKFKNVLIETDEQLLHTTRYIHRNPVKAGLVKKAEEWRYSSYQEYIGMENGICDFKEFMNLSGHEYKKFVEDTNIPDPALPDPGSGEAEK